jgi:hypothetical protein
VNERDGAWFSLTDGTTGSQQPHIGGWTGQVMEPVDGDETNRAIHYIGYGFSGSGSGDGWHLFGTSLLNGLVYDLTAYDGIAFWVRADCETPGSEQAMLRVAISDSQSEGSSGAVDHAGSSIGIELTEEWKQVKLSFGGFLRRFGPGVFDQETARKIYFSPVSEGKLDLWLDDLVFYSDE